MIENYKIILFNGEERLILFLNLNYEFGGKNGNIKGFKQTIIDYIKNNKIHFHGGIIMFVVGGIMIGNVIFNNNEFSNYMPTDNNYNYVSDMIVQKLEGTLDDTVNEVGETVLKNTEVRNANNDAGIETVNKIDTNSKKANEGNISTSVNSNSNTDRGTTDKIIEEKKEDVSFNANEEVINDNNIYVNLKRKDGNIEKIELEEYLIGVVGAEMPALFNIEALKSQAIIARTYALKNTLKGNILRDNESSQSYKTNSELKAMWGGNYDAYYTKVKNAVNETKGVVLMYNGAYIEAVYHSTSNGVTESSVNVWGNYYPYLTSVDSKYDSLNVSFEVKKEMSYQEISEKLGFSVDNETNLKLQGKTSGDRVETVIVGEHSYKGIDFRNILGLRSADFDMENTDTGVIFTTRGYGHGVGMSQYGANGMAKNGYSYTQILKHYYPGVILSEI